MADELQGAQRRLLAARRVEQARLDAEQTAARRRRGARHQEERERAGGDVVHLDSRRRPTLSQASQARYDEIFKVVRAEAVAHLEEQGHSTDFELLDTICHARAMGLLRDEQDPEGPARRARQEERDRLEQQRRWLNGRGFPTKVIAAIQTGHDQNDVALRMTDAEAWLRDKMNSRAQLVVLAGLVGTGKTFAACRWAAEQGDPLYTLARDIFNRSERYDPDRPFLRRVRAARVLIIDEAGTNEETTQASAQLEALMHWRFDRDLRTIICANLLLRRPRGPKGADMQPQFEERYTDRIMSRIYESGGVKICKEICRAGERRRQRDRERKK